MWNMVSKTRFHYKEFVKEFFLECERVDGELKRQTEIKDDGITELKKLRDDAKSPKDLK